MKMGVIKSTKCGDQPRAALSPKGLISRAANHHTMHILSRNYKERESRCMENWSYMKDSETTQVITIKLATLLQERIPHRINILSQLNDILF